ncbi:MAG TPA: hypothetical protein DCP28_36805 [Cytophagales bacterium]|nr:hypothetical protein [Cytophagales bacterium]
MDQTFTFRQITDEQELETFMKLRREIYMDSPKFSTLLQYPVDIDRYDLHSLPFGLFCNGEPAGFIRVILPTEDYYNPHAYRIRRKYGAFAPETHSEAAIKTQVGPQFHVFKYLPDSQKLQDYYTEAMAQGINLTEGSRIILFRKFRGLKAARFLTECTITTYIEHNWMARRHAVICCTSKQQHYYRQYGFELVDDQQYGPYHDQPWCIMAMPYKASLQDAPITPKFRTAVYDAYAQYVAKGQITRTFVSAPKQVQVTQLA